MSMNMDDLRRQITKAYESRLTDVKIHQAALDVAQADVLRLTRVLALLTVEAEDEPCPAEEPDAPAPLEVPHTIDVGALAQALPKTNPFAEAPKALPYILWEILQDGQPRRVKPELIRLVAARGDSRSETSIRHALKRHPTAFQGDGSWYQVTEAYRNPAEPHDA